jgi:hypothetical protein
MPSEEKSNLLEIDLESGQDWQRLAQGLDASSLSRDVTAIGEVFAVDEEFSPRGNPLAQRRLDNHEVGHRLPVQIVRILPGQVPVLNRELRRRDVAEARRPSLLRVW